MKVIKIGGSVISMLDRAWCESGAGIIVHGGSRYVDELSEKMGIKVEKLTSPSGVTFRRTTREVIDVYVAALIRANKDIVKFLESKGINAIGLTGFERELIVGRRKKLIKAVINGRIVAIRDDYSGIIEEINVKALRRYMKVGVPVIASIAYDPVENTPLNIDGDKLAKEIALNLKADELTFLSDTAFLVNGEVMDKIKADELEEFLPFARGGMKRKLLMAKAALEGGVKKVIIQGLNGRTVVE